MMKYITGSQGQDIITSLNGTYDFFLVGIDEAKRWYWRGETPVCVNLSEEMVKEIEPILEVPIIPSSKPLRLKVDDEALIYFHKTKEFGILRRIE